jgi:hypothetical protein
MSTVAKKTGRNGSAIHLDTALNWLDMGFSPLPPRNDGSKAPLADVKVDGEWTWSPYQVAPADRAHVESWYRGRQTGNGVATGVGGLELFEFDDRATYEAFKAAAIAIGLGDLVERIEAGYLETTPGGGIHWFYACDEIRPCTKLAERFIPGEPHKRKTLIETKGQGGFAIVAPSNGKVHPTGGAYRLLRGRPDLIATISASERAALWDLGGSFDEIEAPEVQKAAQEAKKPAPDGTRPGDLYSAEHSWEDILEPLGWTKHHARGDVIYWTRPGKDEGISATTGHCKGLYVFSTSTSFEPRHSYTKFGAYTRLHHSGDHGAAARELAKHYGQQAARRNGVHAGVADHEEEAKNPSRGDEKQSQAIIRLASAATLFHDGERRAYAAIAVNGHQEVHALQSHGFRLWLKRQFYEEQGRPPSAQAFQDALGVIEGDAVFRQSEEEVHLRVAGDADRVLIDLGNDRWHVAEISARGWSVQTESPVRFRRTTGQRPLPSPQKGGDIQTLKTFVNCSDTGFLLLVAWTVCALRPVGPYPPLVLTGEQGSAKSTLARMLRRLIDNHVSLIRAEPCDVRDLVVSAFNGHVLAFDNLSSIPVWLSDALCRLSTGGGFASRTHYTMDEETFLEAQRPIILTGIEDMVTRGDLIDRSLFIHLAAIADSDRRTEREFWAEFDSKAGGILGALFDLLVKALSLLPKVKVSPLPRMADFALLGEAVSQAMGNEAGVFADAYRNTRKAATESAVEDSPVAGAIQTLLSKCDSWEGTAKELLAELAEIVGEKTVEKETKSKAWPKSPKGMGNTLRRLAPSLRQVGVQVDFGERSTDRRPIILRASRSEE